MSAIPPFLISSESCKMNSSDRLPDVYIDTHRALFFENFEHGMRILIHTAPAIIHQSFCPLSFDLSGNFRLRQFKSLYRLERGPAAGGASAIAARGGDGSASIAQMYICALAGELPLTPMPPAGGSLSATLPEGLKSYQLSRHTPKFRYEAKVTQSK